MWKLKLHNIFSNYCGLPPPLPLSIIINWCLGMTWFGSELRCWPDFITRVINCRSSLFTDLFLCQFLDLFSLYEFGIMWHAVNWMTARVWPLTWFLSFLLPSAVVISCLHELTVASLLCLCPDHWPEQTCVSHRDLLEPLGAEGHLIIRPGRAVTSHTTKKLSLSPCYHQTVCSCVDTEQYPRKWHKMKWCSEFDPFDPVTSGTSRKNKQSNQWIPIHISRGLKPRLAAPTVAMLICYCSFKQLWQTLAHRNS